MNDSFLNPTQAEEVDVWVNTCPKRYYLDDPSSQLLSLPDGTTMPVLYDGVLPCLPIRRSAKYDVQNCRRMHLSSRDPWDPFLLNGHFSCI